MDPGAPADGPGRSDHHVLAEHDIGLGKAVKETVIDHRLSAFPRLLRRLEHRHQGPAPAVAGLCKERRCAGEPGDMHVVTAGMHHRHPFAVAVRSPYPAGIGQAGHLLDRHASMSVRECEIAVCPHRGG